ncbi:ATP-binding protein [Acidobacteria bacterium AH-259-G07]|nr:ATP-binding protein [Acidobacteria bacterium AH-259-G07]
MSDSQLPTNSTREKYQPIIVGRSEELAQLWELVLKGRHVLVTGAPGIGKTILLDVLYEGLSARPDVHIFRVGDSRQFKASLVELAEQMHARGVYRHPKFSESVLRTMTWDKLAPKVRALTVKVLAESLVVSLAGRNAILIWDQFDKATPTEVSWLHQFLNTATLLVATSDPSNFKLKVILDRIPARVELEELTESESYELMDRCFEVAPFAVSDLDWYKREIWRKTQGNPRAIKDLLADHSLEKYIDSRFIRSIQSDQGVQYFPISWIVVIGTLLFSIHRYVGRGLGDRDAYIIGAAGMVIFLFLTIVVRKGNKAP